MARRLAPCLILLGLMASVPAGAQEVGGGDPPAPPSVAVRPTPEANGAKASGVSRQSVLSVFRLNNPMLWPLAVCSVVTVGFSLERLFALRRGRVAPRDFIARFTERLASGKLDRDRAMELCKANDSPVSRIFGSIIHYWGQPSATIRQALEHDAAGELLDLRRNCRVLNGTATLAPLLGLLGTVVGMIEAFDSLKSVGQGKSEALAHGISVALVATAVGLCIAIVSVAVYYALLNKVDILSKAID